MSALIIIIIKLCWQHRFPSLSLPIHPYHPSLLVGPTNYIQCPHSADVNKFLLVSPTLSCSCVGSIEEHHLWVYLFFSNSVLHVLFNLLGWFFEMGGKWPYSCCFMGLCFQYLFKIIAFLCSSHLVFSLCFVVHPYSSIDTTTAWKKSCFILSDRSDFHMIDNL